MLRPTHLVVLLLLSGCGKKADSTSKKDDASGPQVAPLSTPISGLESLKRMSFPYDAGAASYEKAVIAYKTKQWAAVRQGCEAALAKDPLHLDAHRLLATALAQLGEEAAAVDHLVTALAADYWKYAPSLATDEDLATFMATQHGQAIAALSAKLREDYQQRTAKGVWLIGRRSTFKWPKDPGVQNATSRGELYAYDRETKRFLRLTHTDHKVLGYVRAASASEVAIVGFDKVDHPKSPDEAPTFANAWVQVIDATEWKSSTPKISLGAAREVSLGYGAGDQLLVSTAPASGRWGVGDATVSAVDRTTGKLTKIAVAPPLPRIVVSLDEGALVRAPAGIEAAWTGDPPTTGSLKAAGTTIQIPESGAATQHSVEVAPGGARVVFATAVDPCAKDAAPSLYVVDAKTGALKHLLTAASRFATHWLDATTLAYEDGDGAIRLWDASTGREQTRIDNKAGIALDVLSLAPAPLCKQAPPIAEPAGPGAGDEPLPPEEPGGPVTAPQ